MTHVQLIYRPVPYTDDDPRRLGIIVNRVEWPHGLEDGNHLADVLDYTERDEQPCKVAARIVNSRRLVYSPADLRRVADITELAEKDPSREHLLDFPDWPRVGDAAAEPHPSIWGDQ